MLLFTLFYCNYFVVVVVRLKTEKVLDIIEAYEVAAFSIGAALLSFVAAESAAMFSVSFSFEPLTSLSFVALSDDSVFLLFACS